MVVWDHVLYHKKLPKEFLVCCGTRKEVFRQEKFNMMIKKIRNLKKFSVVHDNVLVAGSPKT